MFSGLRMWIAAIGSALFGGLILWARMLKKQRDAARRDRDVLIAGRDADRVKERITKEEYSRTAELSRDIKKEKEKDDEDFKGADNLSNPNDY